MLPVYAQSLPDQAACLACHGEDGQSQKPEIPSLGAQPEYYVTIQLVMFRDRLRVVDNYQKRSEQAFAAFSRALVS
jgi:cytochrome c553